MKTLGEILQKPSLNIIGLMSGTSLDGMDAALVQLTGCGTKTSARLLGFTTIEYSEQERAEILRLALGEEGGSKSLSQMNFWLGYQGLAACYAVCKQAGLSHDDVDLVGSHGQTLYHIPVAEPYLGMQIASTLQLGEASVIAEGLGCPVISDFRVRDMAAGGQAAPLVPYSEYLLYRSETQHIGLQNIGGIGNLTVLPRGCSLDQVYAFDTGPGNMVIDRLVAELTGGECRWDEDGRFAAQGQVNAELLEWMLSDPYFAKIPPKTTGREYFGDSYVKQVLQRAHELSLSRNDIIATATQLTAQSIFLSWERYCPDRPELLIVGGGGAHNHTLMRMLREALPVPVKTNEDIGMNGDAKEAVAFAVLANECLHGIDNNVPRVTGARHPVVMGKISQ